MPPLSLTFAPLPGPGPPLAPASADGFRHGEKVRQKKTMVNENIDIFCSRCFGLIISNVRTAPTPSGRDLGVFSSQAFGAGQAKDRESPGAGRTIHRISRAPRGRQDGLKIAHMRPPRDGAAPISESAPTGRFRSFRFDSLP